MCMKKTARQCRSCIIHAQLSCTWSPKIYISVMFYSFIVGNILVLIAQPEHCLHLTKQKSQGGFKVEHKVQPPIIAPIILTQTLKKLYIYIYIYINAMLHSEEANHSWFPRELQKTQQENNPSLNWLASDGKLIISVSLKPSACRCSAFHFQHQRWLCF